MVSAVENGDASVAVQPPLLNGYLKKLGERGIKTFKKRYFRQNGFKLSYYESESDKLDHSKGAINLETIQEVRRCPTHANAFELVSKENKRTYVLQVCEPGDTVEQWLARWNAWLAYVKDSWTRAQKGIGSATAGGHSSVKLTRDLLKLSSFTTVESASGGDLISSYPEETWPQMLSQLGTETADQLTAISSLRAEVEELNQEYRMMGMAKDVAIEMAKTTLQEEIKALEKQLNEAHKTLAGVDQQLISKERLVMSCERSITSSSQLIALREALLKATRDQIDTERRELEAQEKSLSELREVQSHDPSVANQHISSTIQNDVDRLKRHWEANNEQKLISDQLARKMRCVEVAIKCHADTQPSAISVLRNALDIHQAAVASIRSELAEAQHVETKIIDEFENLRKQYFISLTVCIKLQGQVTGKTPAVDLSDLDSLYQLALAENPDHMDWNDWLAEKLFPNTPKSLILGRRRSSVSSSSGDAPQVPVR